MDAAGTHARRGAIEEAISTWTRALDSMTGVRSARTTREVQEMRRQLAPYRVRGLRAAVELDRRAGELLAPA